jgi:hypothetical protein
LSEFIFVRLLRSSNLQLSGSRQIPVALLLQLSPFKLSSSSLYSQVVDKTFVQSRSPQQSGGLRALKTSEANGWMPMEKPRSLSEPSLRPLDPPQQSNEQLRVQSVDLGASSRTGQTGFPSSSSNVDGGWVPLSGGNQGQSRNQPIQPIIPTANQFATQQQFVQPPPLPPQWQQTANPLYPGLTVSNNNAWLSATTQSPLFNLNQFLPSRQQVQVLSDF